MTDTVIDEPNLLRPHAEQQYAHELAALARVDDRPRPPSWQLSPWAVVTYLLGGELSDGTVVSPKYVGPRRLMEVAVATLATTDAPGTGGRKSNLGKLSEKVAGSLAFADDRGRAERAGKRRREDRDSSPATAEGLSDSDVAPRRPVAEPGNQRL